MKKYTLWILCALLTTLCAIPVYGQPKLVNGPSGAAVCLRSN